MSDSPPFPGLCWRSHPDWAVLEVMWALDLLRGHISSPSLNPK